MFCQTHFYLMTYFDEEWIQCKHQISQKYLRFPLEPHRCHRWPPSAHIIDEKGFVKYALFN